MKGKLLFILVSIVFAGYVAMAQIKPSTKEMEKYYRQYVLTQCIYLGFGKDKVFDQDISFTVYNEMTDYVVTNSHGRKLDSLVNKKLSSIEPSQIADYEGRKPILLRCIEYYDSKELRDEVRKILKSPKN